MVLRKLHNQDGFSFFEIVVVMVLIAVLAVIAVVRHRFKDPTLATQTQVLKAHIRYAQARSMNTNTAWGINYVVDGDHRSYWLYRGPQIATKIALPGQTNDHVRLDSFDISIVQGAFSLEFDSWGRPSSSLSGAGTLTLNLNNANESEALIVTQNTGFIP